MMTHAGYYSYIYLMKNGRHLLVIFIYFIKNLVYDSFYVLYYILKDFEVLRFLWVQKT